MRLLTLTATALVAASPLPALAQDMPPASVDEPAAEIAPADQDLSELAGTLSDPDVQENLTRTLETLGEVLLDLPLAPLADAAAQMAGEEPGSVDPDLTLRRISPEAERLPNEIADNLPRMMDAMAGMAQGLEAMLPALRDMADRMEEATGDLR